MSSTDECSICLGDIFDKAKPAGCKHTFCKQCIWNWGNINGSCPYCRTFMSSIHISFNGNEYTEILKIPDKPRNERQAQIEQLVDRIRRDTHVRDGKLPSTRNLMFFDNVFRGRR